MMINLLSFTIGVATSQGNTYTVGIEDLTQVLNFASTNLSNEASFTSLENYCNNFQMFTILGKSEVKSGEFASLEAFKNFGL
jgi:hypothetical protein